MDWVPWLLALLAFMLIGGALFYPYYMKHIAGRESLDPGVPP
jgi:hypothetical protein